MPTNVLIFSIDAKSFERLIAPAHADFVVRAVETLDEAEALIEDCEILLSFGSLLRGDILARARRLKWVQSLGTGVDGIVDSPHVGPHVIVTAARGIHGAAMAETLSAEGDRP